MWSTLSICKWSFKISTREPSDMPMESRISCTLNLRTAQTLYRTSFSIVSDIATPIRRPKFSATLVLVWPQRNSNNYFHSIDGVEASQNLWTYTWFDWRFLMKNNVWRAQESYFFHFHQTSSYCLLLMIVEHKLTGAKYESCWIVVDGSFVALKME